MAAAVATNAHRLRCLTRRSVFVQRMPKHPHGGVSRGERETYEALREGHFEDRG